MKVFQYTLGAFFSLSLLLENYTVFHISILLLLCCYSILGKLNDRKRYDDRILLITGFCLIFSTSFTLAPLLFNNSIGSGWFWWAFTPLMILSFRTKKDVYNFIVSACLVFLMMYFYDLFLRLLIYTAGIHFHALKYGLIGPDTNYTAIYLMFLSMCLMCMLDKERSVTFVYVIVIFLLLGTLSRAALIAWLLCGFVLIINRCSHWMHYVLLCCTAVVCLLLAAYVSADFLADASLFSKLEIWTDALNFANENFSIIQYILGYGEFVYVGSSKLALHNLIFQYLFIGGFLSLSLLLCFAPLALLTSQNRFMSFWWICYIVPGLSFMLISHPIINLCFALMYLSTNKKDRKKRFKNDFSLVLT